MNLSTHSIVRRPLDCDSFMERLSSNAIKSLAAYGDSDEEIAEEVMELDDDGTVRVDRVVVRRHRSPRSAPVSGSSWSSDEEGGPPPVEPPPPPRRSEFQSSPSPTMSKQPSGISLVQYGGGEEAASSRSSLVSGESGDDAPVFTVIDEASGFEATDWDESLDAAIGVDQWQDMAPCPDEVERKFEYLFNQKTYGFDFNKTVQSRTDFRNPSIYEKLVDHFGIDELGTNFPKSIFDPHGFKKHDYYDEIAKAQKIYLSKVEKASKEKKEPDVPGKGATAVLSLERPDKQKRKSKWSDAVEKDDKEKVHKHRSPTPPRSPLKHRHSKR